MNSSHGTRARAFVGALLASVMALSSGGAGFAAAPAVKLSPTSDHPTATDQVSGSGFGAFEAVDIYFDTTDMLLATTTATGTIPWHPWQVPADATPGEHWITAIGRHTGDAAQKPFIVSTDWPQQGYSPRGKRFNPYENVLNTTTAPGLDMAWAAPTGSQMRSAPAVVNGVVYEGSTDGNLYAWDAVTGAPLWHKPTGNQIWSSPAVAKGIVYVGSTDGKLYAFNATTGASVWTATTGNGIYDSPTVANGVVYAGSQDGNLYAWNAATGALLWSTATGSSIGLSSPAVGNGRVYIGTEDGKVRAFNASTGAVVWIYATTTSGNTIESSPAWMNGLVFIGGGYDEKLYALNDSTGSLAWSGATANTVGPSSPAVANGFVYIGSDDGKLYAFRASNGALQWTATTNAFVDPSPAVANGVVYAASFDSSLYAYSAVNGVLLWSASEQIATSPTVANGFVYAGSFDNNLYAYALNAGNNAVYKNRKTQPPSFATLHPDFRLKPDASH